MRRVINNKLGVSAVVATVLIVMITVAAVGIIWAAIIPMVRDSLSSSGSCNDVDISIANQGYTCYDSFNEKVAVQIKKGSNDVNVSKLKFYLSSSGNSVFSNESYNFAKNEYHIFYLNASGISKLDGLEVVPSIFGKDCSKVVLNSNIPNCNLSDVANSPVLSSEKKISSFSINNVVGVINENLHTISIVFGPSIGLDSLIPIISFSSDASVSPASGIAQNFGSSVEYTVTAKDGSIQKYIVSATNKACDQFSYGECPIYEGCLQESEYFGGCNVGMGTLTEYCSTYSQPDCDTKDFTSGAVCFWNSGEYCSGDGSCTMINEGFTCTNYDGDADGVNECTWVSGSCVSKYSSCESVTSWSTCSGLAQQNFCLPSMDSHSARCVPQT